MKPTLLLVPLICGMLLNPPKLAADHHLDGLDQSEQPRKNPKWNVRVEVLMVAMPQERALALLPELRDPARIEAAVAQVLAAVDRKEATLIGYPIVHAMDGERSVTEVITEKCYPTDFEPPAGPRHAYQAPPPTAPIAVSENPLPTTFETRNLGVTLEVEPHVSANGQWIRVNVVPQIVALLGFDSYDAVKTVSGKVIKIDQPQFATTKTTANLKLRNGKRCLLALHKSPRGENQIELFIIQAVASRTK